MYITNNGYKDILKMRISNSKNQNVIRIRQEFFFFKKGGTINKENKQSIITIVAKI